MSDVFLDTVGLLAVWDEADQWHAAADEAYQLLATQGRRVVTRSLVLLECGNASARRRYRPRVNVLRQSLIQEGLLIEPTAQEMELAWGSFDRGEAGEAGIVDHIPSWSCGCWASRTPLPTIGTSKPRASRCFSDLGFGMQLLRK